MGFDQIYLGWSVKVSFRKLLGYSQEITSPFSMSMLKLLTFQSKVLDIFQIL